MAAEMLLPVPSTAFPDGMLFYVKRFIALEFIMAGSLGSLGLMGMDCFGVPFVARLNPVGLGMGVAGAGMLTCWTMAVQKGYGIIKSRSYADALTRALARYFAAASVPQAAVAGFAAASEEIFFRGFVQGRWGLLAGAVAFMVAHIGGRDIRVIGYWSFFHGLWLGLFYAATRNLLVPVVAHALFDVGAMLHFRRLMATAAPE